MAKEYFPAYHSYLEAMEELTDAERGRLFTACLQYSKTGEAPQLSGNERYLFPAFRAQIDRDNAEYARKCATNRRNGERGGPRSWANGTEGYRTLPNAPQEEGKGKGEGEEEKERTPSGSERKPFRPPTVEEVDAYCAQRGNGIDGAAFVDFYTARGWMAGRTKMKDWRAAVRTWERRQSPAQPKEDPYADVI